MAPFRGLNMTISDPFTENQHVGLQFGPNLSESHDLAQDHDLGCQLEIPDEVISRGTDSLLINIFIGVKTPVR